MKWLGATALAIVALAALGAPMLAPQDPGVQLADHVNAPPMRLRLVDDRGSWRAPFVYAVRLVDRLESRYEEDHSRIVSLVWFRDGRLVGSSDPEVPLLILGADSLGRDVFARLLHGARVSLGVAVAGALGALVIGVLVGGLAGFSGGLVDELAMRVADFVLVLPAVYVVLALRAVLPVVLNARDLFVILSVLLAAVGWPYAARGVRAIVAAERQQDYAVAARSLGAGPWRLLVRHLLPACRGFLSVQMTLLLPAFILAEVTLSFVGLGFPDPVPSWGTMLMDVRQNVRALTAFPWLLSPAAAIVLVVLSVNLVAGGRPEVTVLTEVGADR